MTVTNLMKRHYSRNLTDFYRNYKRNKKKEGLDFLNEKRYKSFIKTALFNIMYTVLRNNAAFILPYSLGYIYVYSRKRKPTELRINFALTKQYRKTIYYLKDHAWGYLCYFKWDKYFSIFKNKSYYNMYITSYVKMGDREIGGDTLQKFRMELARDPERKSLVTI